MYSSPFDSDSHIKIKFRSDRVKNYMNPDLRNIYPHFHYLYEILYIKEGEANFIVSDQVYHVQAGSVLFISNLESHSIQLDSPRFQRYSVCISHDFLTAYVKVPVLLSIFTQRSEGFRRTYQFHGEARQEVESLLRQLSLEFQAKAANWDISVALRIIDLLIILSRQCPDCFPAAKAAEANSTVFEVQTYISQHLAEELTLDDIAARFYISKFHLSHLFKEMSGYTLKQYIILERISKAKDLLIHTDQRVSDISKAVGFGNVSHFIRTFRELENIPPAKYRKLSRQTQR